MRCAYLTMDEMPDWAIDNELAFEPMVALGWQVHAVPWRSGRVDWDSYDAVYIGFPWDYPEEPQRFMRLLETIDRSDAVLVNDLALVRWTLAKTYLRDLEKRGIPTVPGIWGDAMSGSILRQAFDRFAADTLIVKPVVSTNATDTFKLARESFEALADDLHACFTNRAFVIQPFIENIRSEGEYSLFYFGSVFSHAIRKLPQRGDFRVQEQFGATIEPVEADDELRNAGRRLLREVEPQPVYARCDFVRGDAGHFLLMELELIEPSLYLGTNQDAPGRFAKAFDARVRSEIGRK